MNNWKVFQPHDELMITGGGKHIKNILEWNPALWENLVR